MLSLVIKRVFNDWVSVDWQIEALKILLHVKDNASSYDNKRIVSLYVTRFNEGLKALGMTEESFRKNYKVVSPGKRR